MQDGLNKDEEKQLVELLSKLEPGFLPYGIFVQIARLVVMPIIEFVPLRLNKGSVEVLLLHRGKDDPIWPDEWHTPGTVIRATDNQADIYKAFERIIKDELRGTQVSNGHFVGTILHPSKRGVEHAQIFWVEVLGEPAVGEFYPADNLPVSLIESQRKFIGQAVKSFSSVRG